jgi:hypothetical protein
MTNVEKMLKDCNYYVPKNVDIDREETNRTESKLITEEQLIIAVATFAAGIPENNPLKALILKEAYLLEQSDQSLINLPPGIIFLALYVDQVSDELNSLR